MPEREREKSGLQLVLGAVGLQPSNPPNPEPSELGTKEEARADPSDETLRDGNEGRLEISRGSGSNAVFIILVP